MGLGFTRRCALENVYRVSCARRDIEDTACAIDSARSGHLKH